MTDKRFTLEWYAQKYQELTEENEELKQQLMDCEKFRHTVYQRISKEMTQHD